MFCCSENYTPPRLAAASTVSIMGIRSAHKRVIQRVHKLRKMQMERQKLLGLALLVQFVCACVRARPAWRADSNSLLLVFRYSFFYFFSLSNNAFPMQQKPPANSQSPPIKGRAMPGVYNQMAELTEIKPETKNRWLIAHSPLVRTLGIFFTSCFGI